MSRRARPEFQFGRAITFDPTVGSPSIIIEEFPDAVFLGVDVESQLGEAGLVAPDQSTGLEGP